MDSRSDFYGVLREVIAQAHLASGSDLPWILTNAAAKVGMEAELYLADVPQRDLHPVRADLAESVSIESTLAGRAFQLVELLAATDERTRRPILWVPVLDGASRLGVLQLLLPERTDPTDRRLREHCWALAGLLGTVLVTKLPFSDYLHRIRRPRPLTVSAELLWQLLPPRTFACRDMTISATVEYYDEAGGDGFDYAADNEVGDVAVFDATGHDLLAGTVCSLAMAATRNARRRDASLPAIAARADEVLRGNAPERRFATAVLARLRLDTGVLSYLNAGHPPPVLLRAGKARKTLDGGRRLPLGLRHLDDTETEPATERLEPGDRVLLYTDGVIEARDDAGEQFGLDRLTDLVERHSAAGLPAPETLRRLSHAVLDHQQGQLRDDATLVLLEWPTPDTPPLLPALT